MMALSIKTLNIMTLNILELIITTGSMKRLNIRNVFMLMLYKYDIQHLRLRIKTALRHSTYSISYPGKLFKPSLIFPGKAGAYPRVEHLNRASLR
jgi:hypothetical protein